MDKRAKYTEVTGTGIVEEDAASLEIVSPDTGTTDVYLYIEKMYFSVFKAAAGGGGILEIKDTDGEVFFTVNVDAIKDVPFDFGEEGIRISDTKNVGLQAVVSGAATQASASVAVICHFSPK